jgi:hypothetical protein
VVNSLCNRWLTDLLVIGEATTRPNLPEQDDEWSADDRETARKLIGD